MNNFSDNRVNKFKAMKLKKTKWQSFSRIINCLFKFEAILYAVMATLSGKIFPLIFV